MMQKMLIVVSDKSLATDERKAQLREAQSRYRQKQKAQGRKEQPFVLSEEDHENMAKIIQSAQ